MLQDLTGQVAWITGGGTGIGESGAIKLAEAGCQVVLSGRRAEPLEAVAAQIPGELRSRTLPEHRRAPGSSKIAQGTDLRR